MIRYAVANFLGPPRLISTNAFLSAPCMLSASLPSLTCSCVSDYAAFALMRYSIGGWCVIKIILQFPSQIERFTSLQGNRAFRAAGPRVWNSLPTDLRQPNWSYSRFRQSLKMPMFGQWDQSALPIPVLSSTSKILLLT